MTRRKAVLVTYFFFGLIIIFDCSAIAPDSPTDFRIVTYQDVERDEKVFWYKDKEIGDYSELAIDIPRQQLLLGARNYLLRLDLADLGELEKVKWEPTKMNMTVCKAKGQEVSDCQNYVRVLILNKNKVFACGTNAFAPACSWRESQQLATVVEWVPGIGKCPYTPSFNNTAMMTAQGDLYTATVMDFIGQDPAIYRMMGPSNHLRTLQYNSKWLNEPSFVSSYEIGQYIYFFFRETAVEYINCGKSIYSRVARVCKNDSGGHFLLEDNWTTFMKARLNCSLPGRYPFYFDHLQATYFDHSQQLLYGIFTTPPTSIFGTALCIFNMTSFDVAYSGPFKYQENAQMAWSRVPNEDDATRQCGSSSKVKRSLLSDKPKQHHLVNAKKFQMMDSAVQPVTASPLIVSENERWSHIAVDTVRVKHHETIHVIFVTTLEGIVKKLMRPPGSKVTCIIEEIQVIDPKDAQVITKMQLLGDQGALFLTTNNRVIRIPVQRCHRFKTKDLCVKSQDPYCGWHSKLNMCSPVPSSLPYHGWHQDIKSCPVTEYPVDGGWSDWSTWEECRHTGSLANGDRCLCRRRACDNPPPLYEGQQCTGPPVEVTNCTTHGGWTSWSEWSSCSATCGIAMRTRKRTCSNPEPRFDGLVCVGADIDEQYCHEIPICPEPTPSPVDGQWSDWNEWSGCSAVCGGGIQERFRRCDNPQPHHGGKDCVGNSISWQYCNTFDCEELRKSSDWTPWVRVNASKEGYMEQRFKFVCKANVPDPRFLRVTGVKTDLRFCQNSGDSCSDKGIAKVVDVDGEWAQWSSWSRCDRVCDIGVQWRERTCENPAPSGNGKDCLGHGREARECNVHPCQGIWSTWGEWGQCSVTCGIGYKWRSRQCQALAPGRQYTKPCYGNDRDEENCQMPACSRFDGWDEWTLWSECFPQSTQQRKRVCKLPFPTIEQCQGPNVETRMCRYNYIDIQSNEISQMQEPTHRRNNFQVFHLVITGFIGFILGGAVCVGLYMYIQRVRQHAQGKLKEEENPYSTINKSDIKENLYMSPSQISMSNGGPPSGGTLNNRGYYSSGSLIKKDPSKMTVKEATLQRNSLMRTNLSLNDL